MAGSPFTFGADDREALRAVLAPAALDLLERAAAAYIKDPAVKEQAEWCARARAAAPADGWPKGIVLARTPSDAKEQLRRAAAALETARRLVLALPPRDAFHPAVGYAVPTDWTVSEASPTRDPAAPFDPRVGTLDQWLMDTRILSGELARAAEDVDTSKTRHAVRTFNAAIGLAVYLSTGDIEAKATLQVLQALEEIKALGKRTACDALVRDIQDAASTVYVRGHAIKDRAPCFRSP